jgi:hypothetical protein
MSCFGSECRAKHEMSSARMSRIADHGLIFVDISIHTSRERVYNTRCGYMLDAESAEEISMSMPLTKRHHTIPSCRQVSPTFRELLQISRQLWVLEA